MKIEGISRSDGVISSNAKNRLGGDGKKYITTYEGDTI